MNLFKKSAFLAKVCVVAVGMSAPVSASTLSASGVNVLDSATNLAWLTMPSTDGLSPVAAQATFSSYRYATRTEVHQLFLNGDMSALDNIYRASDFSAAQALVSLFGITFGAATSVFGFQGFALDASGVTFSNPFVSISSLTGKVFPGHTGFSSTFGIADVGVFLVRDIAAVPLPGAIIPMLTVIGGFGIAARKRRRKQA